MTTKEKRYIWIIAILVSLCFTLIVGLFNRNYTDDVIQKERVQTREYVDSTISVTIAPLSPKLDTIITMIENIN